MARPPVSAVLRTLRCVCVDVPAFLLPLAAWRRRPAAASTDAAGLAAIARDFRRILARLGLTLEVTHAGRIPAGGCVFMWNQTSHLDHLLLAAAIPRPFFSLYNNEVARVPLYGPHMRRSGHVHVDRRDESQWRPAIAAAAARVAAGECVLLSPEGTRSRDGKLLPLKRGAFALALAARRPIVCVRVTGAHAALPRDHFVVRPGAIRVEFMPPIPTDDVDDAAPLVDRVTAAFADP